MIKLEILLIFQVILIQCIHKHIFFSLLDENVYPLAPFLKFFLNVKFLTLTLHSSFTALLNLCLLILTMFPLISIFFILFQFNFKTQQIILSLIIQFIPLPKINN